MTPQNRSEHRIFSTHVLYSCASVTLKKGLKLQLFWQVLIRFIEIIRYVLFGPPCIWRNSVQLDEVALYISWEREMKWWSGRTMTVTHVTRLGDRRASVQHRPTYVHHSSDRTLNLRRRCCSWNRAICLVYQSTYHAVLARNVKKRDVARMPATPYQATPYRLVGNFIVYLRTILFRSTGRPETEIIRAISMTDGDGACPSNIAHKKQHVKFNF